MIGHLTQTVSAAWDLYLANLDHTTKFKYLIGYSAGEDDEEYPIIGVGVCKGNIMFAYNHTVSYKIGTLMTDKIHKIIYYETPIVSSKYLSSKRDQLLTIVVHHVLANMLTFVVIVDALLKVN